MSKVGRKPRFTSEELIGLKFGRLVIISEATPFTRGKNNFYKCLCVCGREKDIQLSSLTNGKSKSCGKGGCNHATKHGLSRTKEYELYSGIKARCYTKSSTGYKDYGGSGITMCSRWLGDKGFENFLADMGEIPEGLSLDRIDVYGDYSPENCRWANQSLQSYNTKRKKTNTSGRTGVGFYKGTWVASITINSEYKSLGSYELFEDAVKAREDGELKYFGFIKEKV